MKYLCLVYYDEKKLEALSKSEYDALMDEVLAYREALRKSGHYISSDGLESVRDGHDRADPERQGVHDRRPVRRDEGAARRVHAHRGPGPERGHPGGLEDPAGAPGVHRGAADPGARRPRRRDAPPVSRRRGRAGARAGGGRLPLRVAPRPRHADPPARRLRPRRGGAARGLRRRGRAMAAGRRAGQSPRVARLGRPLQGHRQPAPARPVRRVAGRARRAARRRRARRRGTGAARTSRTTACG